jgi:hypothetical protein
MASAFANTTFNSTGANAFSATEDGGRVSSYLIRCRSDSVNPALVNIPNLHEAGEFFLIPIDSEQIFRAYDGGMETVFVKGSGGDTKVDGGVVAKTRY